MLPSPSSADAVVPVRTTDHNRLADVGRGLGRGRGWIMGEYFIYNLSRAWEPIERQACYNVMILYPTHTQLDE